MHECPECQVANDFGTTLSKPCWNCRAPLILVPVARLDDEVAVTVVVEEK